MRQQGGAGLADERLGPVSGLGLPAVVRLVKFREEAQRRLTQHRHLFKEQRGIIERVFELGSAAVQ